MFSYGFYSLRDALLNIAYKKWWKRIFLQSLLLVWLIKILTGRIVLILGCSGRSYTSRQNKTHVTFSHDKKHKSSFGIWACLIGPYRVASWGPYTDNLTQIINLDLRIKIKHWLTPLELLVRVLSILYCYMHYKQRFSRKNSDYKIRTYCIKYYN